ncbi:hypothetical protein J3F83DRAFT_757463 [Trichoderma novae-zelandiae]
MGARNRAFQKQRNGWNQSPRRGQAFASPSPKNDVTHSTGLTLAEEARQTSHRGTTLWASNVQLRKRPVVFVSSGSHDPLQPPTPQTENAKDVSSTPGIAEEAAPEKKATHEATPKEATPVEAAPAGATSEETKPADLTAEETKPFKVTSEEATSEETKPVDSAAERTSLVEAENGEIQDRELTLEQPALHETTPETEVLQEVPLGTAGLEEVAPGTAGLEEVAPEDATAGDNTNHPETDNTGSSDEVIVFKGRGAMKAKTQAPSITLTSIQAEIRVVEEQISAASKAPPIRPAEDDDDSDDLLWPRRKRGKPHGRRHRGKDPEEEAMLADYIANMRENGEMIDGLEGDDEEDGSSSEDEDLPSASLGPSALDVADDSTEDGTDDDDAVDSSGLPAFQVPRSDGLEDDDFLVEHNEFDVMDWERPSVRRRKGKGGRLQFTTEDIDSDLEEILQTAYNNDRQKKAQRKKEREELRAMGLLGNRGQVDLRAKYSTGITMSQVIDEVRSFLAGSQETLSLPPMDPHTRKGVHELAHKFNIKSKSIGAGEQRRPVLYRTKKTRYNEQEFEQVIVRIKRIFGRQPSSKADGRNNRRNQKGPTGPKGPKQAARAGGAFDYHDGEVIGASAPELGTENRGRAMMEKMGWSTGTPLGTSDNQGILHPVSQTMKRTRAGLGQE